MFASPSRMALLCSTTALILCLSFAGPSAAQDQSPTIVRSTAQDVTATDITLPLDPITVYSNRQSTSVRDVPASITVIGQREIESRGLSDMQEITRYTPGVTVSRQTSSADPFNSFSGFMIRGVGGNRVQMQVDGSRVAERIIDGTRDYLDFNFTKQVDVVKGPSSILWGADALGGVVAVTTLDPEDILAGRDRGGIARMSHDTLHAETSISTAFAQRFGQNVTALLGVARTTAHEAELSKARNDGGIYGCPRNLDFGATPCGELDPTDTAANRVLAKIVWAPSDSHRLEVSFDHLDRATEVQYDNVLGPVISSMTGLPTGEIVHDYKRDLDTKRSRIAVEHQWTPSLPWIDDVKTTLAFTPHSYDRRGTRWSTSAAGESIITRDRLAYSEDFYELDIQATSRFKTGAAEHELTWGFDGDHTTTDYSRADITKNLTTGTTTERRAGGFNFANAETNRADLYLQDKISLLHGALEITPGLRFATYRITPKPDADYATVAGKEPVTREDSEILGSLGALYRFGDGWQVWGHYGEGFKMPTAQQLYTSLPGTFFDLVPAPDLEPEYVKSLQLGTRRETARGYFGVTAFKADYSNFIQSFYNPVGTSDYTYRNLSEVRVWGLELEGQYALRDDLRLTGSAAWQKGRQRASAEDLETPHTLPPLAGTLGLSWDASQTLTFDVIGNFASGVRETANPTDFKPGGYATYDLFATWNVSDTAALNLGVKNLFDRRYFEANAATYSTTANTANAAQNPIELQTGAGRVFTASLDVKF